MSTNAPRYPNKNEKKLSEIYPKHAPTPAPPLQRPVLKGGFIINENQRPPKLQEKTRTIIEKYYVTSDGEEFLNKDRAILHQNILDGTSIICPSCHGEGESDYCGDGMGMVICSHCNGKGYLVRTWGSEK